MLDLSVGVSLKPGVQHLLCFWFMQVSWLRPSSRSKFTPARMTACGSGVRRAQPSTSSLRGSGGRCRRARCVRPSPCPARQVPTPALSRRRTHSPRRRTKTSTVSPRTPCRYVTSAQRHGATPVDPVCDCEHALLKLCSESERMPFGATVVLKLSSWNDSCCQSPGERPLLELCSRSVRFCCQSFLQWSYLILPDALQRDYKYEWPHRW